jgi:hypothetical protein
VKQYLSHFGREAFGVVVALGVRAADHAATKKIEHIVCDHDALFQGLAFVKVYDVNQTHHKYCNDVDVRVKRANIFQLKGLTCFLGLSFLPSLFESSLNIWDMESMEELINQESLDAYE